MIYRGRLGRHLVSTGLISQETLKKALEMQDSNGTSVQQWLVDEGHVTEDVLLKAMADMYGVEVVDLTTTEIDVSAVNEVPQTIAERHVLIAFATSEERLSVAFADPGDLDAIDALAKVTDKSIHRFIALGEDIRQLVSRLYRSTATFDEFLTQEAEQEEDEDDDELIDDVPLARYVNDLLDRAIVDDASDIHIEPQEGKSIVRFRNDGMLHVVMEIPKQSHAKVLSRIKLQAAMDIAVTHRPQDGRIRRYLRSGGHVDIRVSTLPTVLGEKAVLRILDQRKIILTPRALGLVDDQMENVENLISRPHGLIAVCGPTGSGKSTTLYAFLSSINKPHLNIVTLEDPVEYRLPGISQTEVNERQNLTFASGLRSILRQDPDVILVGEARDDETARLSVQAALTGHLVFTTLHTNTAVGSISRFINMSVEPYLLASSLTGAISQRLVRKLCDRCKVRYVASAKDRAALALSHEGDDIELYKPVGCLSCHGTGYQGRQAVFEILIIDDEMRDMISTGGNEQQVLRRARERGMKSLAENARALVMSGGTDVSELLRVIHQE